MFLVRLQGIRYDDAIERVYRDKIKINQMDDEWITTDDAARIAGVTAHQIRHLLKQGTILGQKFGRSWMVDSQSVEAYAKRDRKPGPKPKNN